MAKTPSASRRDAGIESQYSEKRKQNFSKEIETVDLSLNDRANFDFHKRSLGSPKELQVNGNVGNSARQANQKRRGDSGRGDGSQERLYFHDCGAALKAVPRNGSCVSNGRALLLGRIEVARSPRLNTLEWPRVRRRHPVEQATETATRGRSLCLIAQNGPRAQIVRGVRIMTETAKNLLP